jgi:undecaprenyl-diphosphatase
VNVRLIDEYNGSLLFLDSSGTTSAHSANMAAIATVMTLEAKWWGAPWIAFAFFTGISRIYTGVHYPSQVIFGWGVGILCGFIVSRTWRAYRENRSKLKAALVVQPPIQSRTD